MSDVERTIESLLTRVAALEAENERLKQLSGPREHAGDRSMPRRALLAAGAGLLGVVAGSEVISYGQVAHAASASEPAGASRLLSGDRATVTGAQYQQPRLLGVRVKLSPRASSTARWARYEWSFGKQFTDARPPIVVASVIDVDLDGMLDLAPTCSVFTYGKPGAYAAMITVHNLADHADHVEVNVLAFGG
jgi:hypothetical protein